MRFSSHCLAATLLLALGPWATKADADVSSASDPELMAAVEKSVAVISILHRKAGKALVNAAQDKAFDAYFDAHDDDHRHSAKDRIDQISLNVQREFRVEEMCLIDLDGQEISRIVGDEIAHDLASDESSADFFAPSLKQGPRSVYTAPLYLSVDADKWVVAYVTPVTLEGERKALLHYEHGLDSYHERLGRVRTAAGIRRFIVDARGWVVWRDNAPVTVNKIGESADPADYFDMFAIGTSPLESVIATLDANEPVIDAEKRSRKLVYRKVADWYVFAERERNGEDTAELDE